MSAINSNKSSNLKVAQDSRHCPSTDNIENEKELSEWSYKLNHAVDKMNCHPNLKFNMKKMVQEVTSAILEDIRFEKELAQRLQPYTFRTLTSIQKTLDENSLIILDRTKLQELNDGGVAYGLTYLTPKDVQKQVLIISDNGKPIPILSKSYQIADFCIEVELRSIVGMLCAIIAHLAGNASEGKTENPYG